jgi:hypothetical protein
MLDMLARGLDNCGLYVRRNVPPSELLERQIWATIDPSTYKRNRMPFIDPDDAMTYLGLGVNPWYQKLTFNAGRTLFGVVRKWVNLLLEPQQKLIY